ncbi:MAG: hypothetical protein M1837_002941 [Sclerophora amabilis]|nr:MAG: hypothetical protein M1837_002941 [Sclerophora amabilis]
MPPTLPQARQTPPKSKQIDTWQAFASREAFATDVTSAMRLQQREAEDSGRSFAFDSDSPPNSGATSPPSVDGGERRVIPVDSATLYDGEGGMRYRHKELFSLSRPEERSVDASSFVNEPSLLD